jgi:hypothetical protein
LEQGGIVMGLFDDDEELNTLLEESNKFKPQELNEGNVQAIFNRCVSNPNSKQTTGATLFPITNGYKSGSEKLIYFDTDTLLKNKKEIKYLFGQLQEVHASNKKHNITIDDYNTTYKGDHWTRDKATLLKLLYLGVSGKINCISAFFAKTSTSVVSPSIKPTLSPKDPNFEAWWAEHKSEWEDENPS